MITTRQGALKAYRYFERAVILVLLVLLMVVILWATVAFSFDIIKAVALRVFGGIRVAQYVTQEDIVSRMGILHDVFGGFLLILIGIELMKTVVMYLDEHVLHVEVVYTVAMIAVARHAIDLNLKNVQSSSMLGLGVLILALAVGYYLFKKTLQSDAAPGVQPGNHNDERERE